MASIEKLPMLAEGFERLSADLKALREDYAKNAAACLDVGPLITKYEKALTKTPRR